MGTTGSCDSGGCKQCCEKKCQGPSEMQEYQPQNKKQMLKESVEMHPPAAVKRSEGENALEDVMADSYFARELEELRELMSKGPDGDRPLFTFKSGATYKGQLKGNQRHGFGCQEWPDGAAFTGEWRENYAEGHGQFIHADGDVFIGQWRKSAAEGLGLYVHKHGLTTYRGQWVQDVQHGIGVEEWEGGSRYDGQFYWGKKQGYGVYSWPDGSLYMGQWDSNAINGYGHYMGKEGRQRVPGLMARGCDPRLRPIHLAGRPHVSRPVRRRSEARIRHLHLAGRPALRWLLAAWQAARLRDHEQNRRNGPERGTLGPWAILPRSFAAFCGQQPAGAGLLTCVHSCS